MRITVLFILTISWHRSGIQTQQCGKPEVTRSQVYIYRRLEVVTVKVNRCLFNDTQHAYSDITDNCMRAFETGIFKDTSKRNNRLRDRGSPVVLEEYKTTADTIKNEIKLRSGATCRYDRGFCYDPSETINYAVVWDVVRKPLQACPTRLELVFFGSVDIWDFQQGHLRYLVFYGEGDDRAFYLKIVKNTRCDNKNVMITEGNSFIVSQLELDSYSRSTTFPKIYPFPLDTKRKISEAIMKNCDLQQYPLDFTNRIGGDYLEDSKNLKAILEYYQRLIIGVKMDVERSLRRVGKVGNSGVWNTVLKNLTNLDSLMNMKVNEINEISNKLKTLQQDVGINTKYGDLNGIIRTIQELKQEDRRILGRIDDEHNAIKTLEQKISDLDNIARKQKSIYPTREEFNRELSGIQKEINSKLQVFINKLSTVLKENFTNLKNNDSQFQKDIADRYDKSIESLESDSEHLSELLENVRNQLESKINVTNEWMIDHFTLIKNNLSKIEQNIPEIQSLLAQWPHTKNNTEVLRKDLQNHEGQFFDAIKLGKMYVRNITTNISSIYETSLNNKYNISEMRNRFENLLKKFSDIDWNVVKTLKPNSISEEECRNEIDKFQKQYDKKLEILGDNLTLALGQYQENCSLQYSDLKIDFREKMDILLNETIQSNSKNVKESVEDLLKRIDSGFSNIKQLSFNNFTILKSDLNEMKFDISNVSGLILGRLNGTENDILEIKTELSNCKLGSVEAVRYGEKKLDDIQKNISNMNNIVLNFGNDILKIEQQINGTNKEISDIEPKLNGKIFKHIEGFKKSLEEIIKQTDGQLTSVKQSTFKNLSLMESELNSIQHDLLINHKPILDKVKDIDSTVETLRTELKELENNSTLNLGVYKNEVNNIRDIVIKTKKRSVENEGNISELKYDLGKTITAVEGIHENNLKYASNLKALNESLKSQEKNVSSILSQIGRFGGVIEEIKSKAWKAEDKIHKCEEKVEQIDKKLLETVDVPDKIGKHATEIDNLKIQVKLLGTNIMDEAVENENALKILRKNVSDIVTTLKDKDGETSDLKSKIQGFVAKFNDNKKLIAESKDECMNYVNSRMKSVTEEIAQIHNLLLKKGEEIRKLEAQLGEKSTACCDETNKNLNDKDILIQQLTKNLDTVMKQVRHNDERVAKLQKIIDDNLYGIPEPISV